MPRPVLPLALVSGLALSGLVGLAPPASAAGSALAASPDVVISEVYGGGGNSGAAYKNDFVELFNRGTAAVVLDGWSVQYGSAANAFSSVNRLSGSLPAGERYLLSLAGGTEGADLPAPDATGGSNLSGSSGKVALVPGTTLLTCGTATTRCAPESYRDLVGYGTAADFEGTAPAPAPSNGTSVARAADGTDTDQNAADLTVGTPTPRSAGGGPVEPPPTGEACEVADPVAVPAVQGRTDTSPYAGQVVTTRGVVTGELAGLSGFFLQDPSGDGDPATSDGVFVFLPSANPLSGTDVAVGDEVALTGTVKEFNGLTEIDTLTDLEVCGTAPVPAPTVYALPEPVQGDLERVEGMQVTVPTELTVQQSFFLGRYGQLTLASGGRRYQPTNLFPAGSPEAQALAAENARSFLFLDDASSAQNPSPVPYLDAQGTRRSGDTVSGLTGFIDFGPVSSTSTVRDHRLQPTADPVFRSAGRPAAPEAVGGSLKAASFNVLNYFTTLDVPGAAGDPRGANSAEEFARQKAKIVAAISGLGADVVGLTEIENNGTVAAQDLVDGLNAFEEAPDRWAVVPDPAQGVGDDAIKVAQIFRSDRVERVGASLSPVDQTAFDGQGRPPVAQTYRERATGGVASLVVNHFKSKGSCPSGTGPDADQGDGQGCWNAVRVAQAEALATFVDTVGTAAQDRDVLVVGDLNAYGEEDPVRTLEAAGLVDLLEREQGRTAYSYVFDGTSGRLDHALATPSLAEQVTGATEWHINADEPSVIDYNTEFKPDDRYAATPYRSSDHDPVLVGTALTGPTPPAAPVVSVADAEVVEGGALRFVVSLSAASTTDTTVRVATRNGTAVAGRDYARVSRLVTVPAGTTSVPVVVTTRADRVDEADETLRLQLAAPTGATLGDATAVGTVRDDDTAQVLVDDAAVVEGGRAERRTLEFVVRLSRPRSTGTAVTFSTADGTATAGQDYLATSGRVVVPAGATTARIRVTVLGDVRREAKETLQLRLSSVLQVRPVATGVVLNDD